MTNTQIPSVRGLPPGYSGTREPAGGLLLPSQVLLLKIHLVRCSRTLPLSPSRNLQLEQGRVRLQRKNLKVIFKQKFVRRTFSNTVEHDCRTLSDMSRQVVEHESSGHESEAAHVRTLSNMSRREKWMLVYPIVPDMHTRGKLEREKTVASSV
eukprot:421055-Rhodomonas_salina.2